MTIENRKYERFSPQTNAFAALGRRYTRIGRIKDISLGGLAFEYISESDTDRNFSQIDIFLIGSVFHLYNLPCDVVYDIPCSVLLNNIESINLSPTNRCGVQFGILTEDDMNQIKLLFEAKVK